MKLKAFTTTAASALVLVAATAGIASAKAIPNHSLRNHPATTTGTKVTKPVLYTAPFGSTPIVTPQYLYSPGGTPDPNAAASDASDDEC